MEQIKKILKTWHHWFHFHFWLDEMEWPKSKIKVYIIMLLYYFNIELKCLKLKIPHLENVCGWKLQQKKHYRTIVESNCKITFIAKKYNINSIVTKRWSFTDRSSLGKKNWVKHEICEITLIYAKEIKYVLQVHPTKNVTSCSILQ